ncbi:terpenoid synthase [Chaetomium strumarium]|uniref:Terpene synthase n=1 Tax=Chaetomium strumarium TaxID=1170767 RepID=A0AAJ0LXZ7_9PEZI|nr:terpenoid synthase [Chaetomium strumarium]
MDIAGPRSHRPKNSAQGVNYIYIPDTLAQWPWPRAINAHYEECKAASESWIHGFNVFSPEDQAAFDSCNFSLLASLAYPNLDKEGCLLGCYLMNLFFVFDQKTDVSNEHETRYLAGCIMDALRHPHKPRPPGEWVGGLIAQRFWQEAIKIVTPPCQRRFIQYFDRYTEAVIQQSSDRTEGRVHDIDSFTKLRRETIGTLPSFALLEIRFNIPDHVMEHPTIQRLTDLCTDLISIGNDLYSYNVEQARGDESHNLVTVTMTTLDCILQEAYNQIGMLHDALAAEFLDLRNNIPSFPEESEAVNRAIREYVDGLGNWVRANECWSFEGGRYFGCDGVRILKDRTVALTPKNV